MSKDLSAAHVGEIARALNEDWIPEGIPASPREALRNRGYLIAYQLLRSGNQTRLLSHLSEIRGEIGLAPDHDADRRIVLQLADWWDRQ